MFRDSLELVRAPRRRGGGENAHVFKTTRSENEGASSLRGSGKKKKKIFFVTLWFSDEAVFFSFFGSSFWWARARAWLFFVLVPLCVVCCVNCRAVNH